MISQIRKLIQDKLISGVNIKTINGSSVLGSGNLTVTGSGVSDGDKGDITVSSSGTVWTIDNNAVTNAKINDVDWSKVTGEPTTLSGYGISDTKANFNTACSDGNFLFVGDVTQYTDEMAQDAVGAMVDTSLTYDDATPRLSRSALTGAITASAGSNTTALGTFTKAELDTAVSDGVPLFVGDIVGVTDGDKGDITVSSSGTVWNIDAATVGVTELSATGTANNTTFLRGDNTWASPAIAYTLNAGLANDLSTGANTNNNNITGFSFTYAANSVYRINIYGIVQAAATTTGYGFNMDVSTAVTSLWLLYNNASSTSGGATAGYSRADALSAGVTSAIAEANQTIPVYANGILITGANTGTCQFVFRSETNAVITLKAGTRIIVEKVA